MRTPSIPSPNLGGIGFSTRQTALFENPDKFTNWADGAPYNARTYVPIRPFSEGFEAHLVPNLAQSQEADRLFSENPSNPAHLFPGGANRFYTDTRDPVANPPEVIANGALRLATPNGVASGPAASGFPRDNIPTPNLYLDAMKAAQPLFGTVPPSNAPLFPMQAIPDGTANSVTPQGFRDLRTPQNNRRSAIPDGVTPTSMQTVSAFVPAFSSAPLDHFHVGHASTNTAPAWPQSLFTQLMSGGPDSPLAADDAFSQASQPDEAPAVAENGPTRFLAARTYDPSQGSPFVARPTPSQPSPDGSLSLNDAYLEYLRRLNAV